MLVAALAVPVAEAQPRGTADIVWQHVSGQVHYWAMWLGQRVAGGVNISTPVAGDWALRGVGDVNGDGTADIVWQHASGQVHYWAMQGGQRLGGGGNISTPVGRDWVLRGVGDVNGDGTADIIWQHASGQVHYWAMQGGQRVDGVNIFNPVAGDWALRGVGDVVGLGEAVGQRKSINALTASELMVLRRGVTQMMEWNTAPRDSANYRRSWEYWANMHAHFGGTCSEEINRRMPPPGMADVQNFTASNRTETATWCQCEHSPRGEINVRFLTWHRMYLWYFERVLQAAAGAPSLRLPYWDYTTDDGRLPVAYRDEFYVNEAGRSERNPLRVEARQSDVNAGRTGLSETIRSARRGAMEQNTFDAFTDLLEERPHSTVHCALGVGGSLGGRFGTDFCGGGLMGAAQSAALDPIFYAHHANIDRLYECWLRVNEAARLPRGPTHLTTQYTFVDADGSAPPRRVSEMLRLSQLGYSYTAGGDCPAGAAVAVAARGANVSDANPAAAASEQPVMLAGPTRLERGVTTVRINVPPATPSDGRRVHVVIEDLTFDIAPGILYNVYLADDGGRREPIGVISFFRFTTPHAGAHAGHDSSAARYTFDATDAVQRLSFDAAAQPSLVFEPTTGLMDSSPAAAAAQISPQANVRFDSAWLVTVP